MSLLEDKIREAMVHIAQETAGAGVSTMTYTLGGIPWKITIEVDTDAAESMGIVESEEE